MALANGLLVHGPRHWAAAVRDDDGRLIVASGKKHLFRAGPVTDLPFARGLVRLGEAFAVLPSVRRGLPQARFAMEDRRTISIAIGATVVAAVARRRIRSILAQEAVGAVAGLAPAMLTLRGSRAAVWHAVEHKSIAAYEAGGADEVAHAEDHAKEHDRCGSNLILPLLVSSTIGNTIARRMFRGRAHRGPDGHRRAQHRLGRRDVLLLGAPAGAPGVAGDPRRGPRDAGRVRHHRAEPRRHARRPRGDGGPAARRGGGRVPGLRPEGCRSW